MREAEPHCCLLVLGVEKSRVQTNLPTEVLPEPGTWPVCSCRLPPRESLVPLNIQVVHPASGMILGSLDTLLSQPASQAALPPGANTVPVRHLQQRRSTRQFVPVQFVLWSPHLSSRQMGPFQASQQNQVSELPWLGARGWGMRQGKRHLVRSLGSSQRPPLGTVPASSLGCWLPESGWGPHSQPHWSESLSRLHVGHPGSFCLSSVRKETGRRGVQKKIPCLVFPPKHTSRASSVQPLERTLAL